MKKNKSKATTNQMPIENRNHLNKVDLQSNSTKKIEIVTRKSNKKQSIDKTDEIKCSNRYETLYTDDNDDPSCNSYDSSTFSDGSISSDEISVEISKEKKSKNLKVKERKRKEMKRKDRNNVIKEKDETTKERASNLHIHKNRYYHQSKAPAERIQSTFSSVITKNTRK